MSTSIVITFSGNSPEEVLSAVRRYTALSSADVPNVPATPLAMAAAAAAGPKRGRPPKASAEPEGSGSTVSVTLPAPLEEFKSITPQPADAVAEDVAPPPSAAPAADAPTLSKGEVQKILIEVVKAHGAEACGALCRKYGGPNLSSLKVETWPSLVADARALLETEPASG